MRLVGNVAPLARVKGFAWNRFFQVAEWSSDVPPHSGGPAAAASCERRSRRPQLPQGLARLTARAAEVTERFIVSYRRCR
jgi:hypothetical protein